MLSPAAAAPAPAKACPILPDTTLGDDVALVAENMEAILASPDRLGYRGAVIGAMGGGHVPERVAALVGRLAAAAGARAGSGGVRRARGADAAGGRGRSLPAGLSLRVDVAGRVHVRGQQRLLILDAPDGQGLGLQLAR